LRGANRSRSWVDQTTNSHFLDSCGVGSFCRILTRGKVAAVILAADTDALGIGAWQAGRGAGRRLVHAGIASAAAFRSLTVAFLCRVVETRVLIHSALVVSNLTLSLLGLGLQRSRLHGVVSVLTHRIDRMGHNRWQNAARIQAARRAATAESTFRPEHTGAQTESVSLILARGRRSQTRGPRVVANHQRGDVEQV